MRAQRAAKVERVLVRGHVGKMLQRTAEEYPELGEAVLEQIQNGLDAGARRISVHIDFARSVVMVRDNGEGVSIADFDAALQSIGVSSKLQQRDKLGRFGIGLISPLGKCVKFIFTSGTKDQSYYEWTFVSDDIIHSEDWPSITRQERRELIYSRKAAQTAPQGKTYVNWRTQVRIERFTTDRTLSRIEMREFQARLLAKYGKKMRKLNSVISIRLIQADGREETAEVKAEEFEGTKLPVWRKNCGAVGLVKIELYRAPVLRGKPSGTVLIGETGNLHRLEPKECRNMLRRIMGDDNEALLALLSGHFNGELQAEKLELRTDRKGFKENDAALAFREALVMWYIEVGADLMEAVKDDQRGSRWERTGAAAMEALRHIMGNNPALKSLLEHLRLLTSSGHVSPELQMMTDPPDCRSGDGSGRGAGSSSKLNRTERPQVTSPPSGSKRQVPRGLLGLKIAYSMLDGDESVAVFHMEEATIEINVRHALWQICEGMNGDSALTEYQRQVIAMMLLMQAEDEHRRPSLERALTTFLQMNIEGMVNARRTKMATARAGRTKLRSVK